MIKVVHCKKSKYDVYIGRPSKWANPFFIGKDGTRKEVIEKYKKWILSQPKLIKQAKKELKNKILGCWCSPKPCHGDILMKIANEKNKMKRLVLIDGNNLAYRSFFTHIKFFNSKGKHTGVIFGIMQSLLFLRNKINIFSEQMVIVWDHGKCTYRKNPYAKYKGGRTNYAETVEEFKYFYPEIEETQSIINKMGIQQIKVKGVEADDLIGIISSKFRKIFDEIIIITCDKDFWQLIRDNVKVYDPMKKVFIDDKYIKKVLGISRKFYKDYKALVGDKSDNISGINGIGPKRAMALINEHGNIKAMIKAGKIQKDDIKKLKLFKKLVTIIKKFDNSLFDDAQKIKTKKRIKKIKHKIQNQLLTNIKETRKKFIELEFKSLMNSLNKFYGY